jgi:hypothetical protein
VATGRGQRSGVGAGFAPRFRRLFDVSRSS